MNLSQECRDEVSEYALQFGYEVSTKYHIDHTIFLNFNPRLIL